MDKYDKFKEKLEKNLKVKILKKKILIDSGYKKDLH